MCPHAKPRTMQRWIARPRRELQNSFCRWLQISRAHSPRPIQTSPISAQSEASAQLGQAGSPWRRTTIGSKIRRRASRGRDAIGEWQAWEELIALAGEALDHGPRCTLLHKLKRSSWQKLDFALADPQTSLRLREDEGDALEIPGRTPDLTASFPSRF